MEYVPVCDIFEKGPEKYAAQEHQRRHARSVSCGLDAVVNQVAKEGDIDAPNDQRV